MQRNSGNINNDNLHAHTQQQQRNPYEHTGKDHNNPANDS